MRFPSNEAETIELYKLMQERLGWRIVHLQTAFPDAVIENRRGAKLTAEFEYQAKNFQLHGHNPDGCDLIVCWHNNWPDAPLSVWALEDCAKEEAQIIQRLLARERLAFLSGAAEDLKHFTGQLHRIRLGLEAEVVNLRDSNRLLARVNELQMENTRLQSENKMLRWRQFESHTCFYIGGVELYTDNEVDTKRFGRLLNELTEIPEAVDLIHADAKAYHDLSNAIQKGDWETLESLARRGYYKPTLDDLQYPGAERLAEFVEKT